MNKNIIINIISLNLILSLWALYYLIFILDVLMLNDNIKYIIFTVIFILEFIWFLIAKNFISKNKYKKKDK